MFQKTRSFWKEFRNFAVKGNAIELAIAVVIGNAFTAIVNSLVGNIITPLLGLLTNNVDFKTLTWQIGPNDIIGYGILLQAIFNFFVVALSIFLVFKLLTGARERIFKEGEQAVAPEQKPSQERLLEEIRDLLKAQAAQK